MILTLLAPALWNGFPLLFADTGGYLARPFERTLLPGRSALYGGFLALGMKLDFWPVIVVQATVTLWVVLLTIRSTGIVLRPALAGAIMFLLTIFTSLPWYVSYLMPDIFVPLAVLCLYLLAFARDRLRGYETAGVSVVAAVAMTFHMSILALSILLIAVLAFAPLLRLPRPRLLLPIMAVGAGLLLGPLSNLAITGRFAFTPGGTHFVFARLIQDGIIARYVSEHCPSSKLAICAYAHELPANADGWLWGWNGPFYKLGGWDGYEPEARRIILDTLLLYPVQHLTTAATDTLNQFVSFRTGEGVNPHDLHHTLPVLEKLAPEMMPRVRAAAQQHDAFDFVWINRVDVPAAIFGFLLLIIALFPRAGASPELRALAATVLLALCINAGICGALSNPNDRYQARIVPLVALAALLILLRIRHQRRAASLDNSPVSARIAVPKP
jgi:hypothetical protein